MFWLFNRVVFADLLHGLFVTRFGTRICVFQSVSLAIPFFVPLQRPFEIFLPHHFLFQTTIKHIFQRGMPQIHPQPHIAQEQQIRTRITVSHVPCVKVYSLTIKVEVETQKAPDIRVVEVLGTQTGPPFSVKWCIADMKYPLFAAKF